jgi:hypothetical protein
MKFGQLALLTVIAAAAAALAVREMPELRRYLKMRSM